MTVHFLTNLVKAQVSQHSYLKLIAIPFTKLNINISKSLAPSISIHKFCITLLTVVMTSPSFVPGVFLSEADTARQHDLPTIKDRIESSLNFAWIYALCVDGRLSDILREAKTCIEEWHPTYRYPISIKNLLEMQKKFEEVSASITRFFESLANKQPELALYSAKTAVEADIASAKLWLRVAILNVCHEQTKRMFNSSTIAIPTFSLTMIKAGQDEIKSFA